MGKVKLGDIAVLINGDRGKNYPSQKEIITSGGIPFVNAGHLNGRAIEFEAMNYITPEKYEKLNSGKFQQNDILYCLRGSLGKKALINDNIYGAIASSLVIIRPNLEKVRPQYLMLALETLLIKEQLFKFNNGSSQPNLSAKSVKEYKLELPDLFIQDSIISKLEKVRNLIEDEKQEKLLLDNLIQSRFVELFGDLKSNNKRWPIVGFNECADIDTNMIHNFEGYEDYPHIGINCIEKETGRLIGYRTIAEDGVISGKYLFTPKHIIYSKIRPNLNKVALPDFKGLCSADAYPILVKSEICNREYFGYTLRSKYFLDYILAFSNRTNLPKVNKNQVEGFMLPLPPIDLQNQFAAFVQQVNKSKFAIIKFLYCFIDNKQSIIKPRPNTKESGKIRGGKPHADEF